MLSLEALEKHMHQLESQYEQCQNLDTLPQETLSYFLAGVDAARQIMNGNSIEFDYQRSGLRVIESPKPLTSSVMSTKTSSGTSVSHDLFIRETTDFLFEYYPQIEDAFISANKPQHEIDQFKAQFRKLIERKQ